LADLLWPDFAGQAARNSLNTALSSLRRQLEPPGVSSGAVLIADRFVVRLNPEAMTTDVDDFRTALRAARDAAQESERRRHLMTACDLYQGELMAGYYDEWITDERAELADLYGHTLSRLQTALMQAGDVERALAYGHRAIQHDPLQEEAHVALMRLYAAAGQPDAALKQYERLVDILDEQLQVIPSAVEIPLNTAVKSKGALWTAFVADPTDEGDGAGAWWPPAYTKPDVALNHPLRWTWTPATSTTNDVLTFNAANPANPADREFYFMKGL